MRRPFLICIVVLHITLASGDDQINRLRDALRVSLNMAGKGGQSKLGRRNVATNTPKNLQHVPANVPAVPGLPVGLTSDLKVREKKSLLPRPPVVPPGFSSVPALISNVPSKTLPHSVPAGLLSNMLSQVPADMQIAVPQNLVKILSDVHTKEANERLPNELKSHIGKKYSNSLFDWEKVFPKLPTNIGEPVYPGGRLPGLASKQAKETHRKRARSLRSSPKKQVRSSKKNKVLRKGKKIRKDKKLSKGKALRASKLPRSLRNKNKQSKVQFHQNSNNKLRQNNNHYNYDKKKKYYDDSDDDDDDYQREKYKKKKYYNDDDGYLNHGYKKKKYYEDNEYQGNNYKKKKLYVDEYQNDNFKDNQYYDDGLRVENKAAYMVYGNENEVGHQLGPEPVKVKYSTFRRTNDALLNQLIQELQDTKEIKEIPKRKPEVILVGSRPTLDNLANNPALNQYLGNALVMSEEDENVAAILDDSSEEYDKDSNLRRSNKKKKFDRKVFYANNNGTREGCNNESSEDSGGSEETSDEKNPGNPYTIFKNKYKQNWMWNHFMDGDHMNINPLGPKFANQGPSGAALFFGRKWWYFNQDDYKPFRKR